MDKRAGFRFASLAGASPSTRFARSGFGVGPAGRLSLREIRAGSHPTNLQFMNTAQPIGRAVFMNGEGGIRTRGPRNTPTNGLANRRIQPLCHLSGCCVGPRARDAMLIGARLAVSRATGLITVSASARTIKGRNWGDCPEDWRIVGAYCRRARPTFARGWPACAGRPDMLSIRLCLKALLSL